MTPHELNEITGISVEAAKKAIQAAKESTTLNYETGRSGLREKEGDRQDNHGSKELDELIGGGIETGAITETYGRFASGKTQIGFQLCVNVAAPKGKGRAWRALSCS